MFRKEIKEEAEVVDTPNKRNNNSYESKFKIFGFTLYTHKYQLTWKKEEVDNKTIGFKQSE